MSALMLTAIRQKTLFTLEPRPAFPVLVPPQEREGGPIMDGIIYLVGLIVIVMAILSFFGLR